MYNKKLAMLIVFFVIIVCVGVNAVFAVDNGSMGDLSTNIEIENTVSDISAINPSYDVTKDNALKKDTSTDNITQKNTNKYNNINNKQKQEETNNTIKTTTNTINTNTKTTGTGNFKELQETITNNTNGTITLDKDYTRNSTEYQNGITINKTITINGNGYTIDGINNGRIFQIAKTGNLTLNNITLTKGQTTEGGAIYNNGGTLTINNCTLTQNTATATEEYSSGWGGAIYNKGGTITITNSTLTQNTATGQGSSGGAIYNNGGTLTITNSTLTHNTATATGQYSYGCGGAIYTSGGTLTITNSTITHNTATGQNSVGGAINSDRGTLTINNCTLTYNKANDCGGAIHINWCNLNVGGSVFLNNTAGSGSAVSKLYGNNDCLDGNWWGSNKPNWSNLLGNINDPSSFVVMGFINSSKYDKVSVDMFVCSYLNGTKIQVDLPLRTVQFSTEINNGTFNPNSTNFTGNTTTIYTGNTGILKANIDNENLEYKLYNPDSFTQLEYLINTTLNNSILSLEGNFTRDNNETGYTDGILINKNILIEGNGFTINGTSLNGTTGRIFQVIPEANLCLNNTILAGGNVTGNGGAIIHNGGYLYGGFFNITNSVFINNIASSGGAINGEKVIIINSAFINNVAFSGGAIDVFYGYIENSNFTNNIATKNDGGAILGGGSVINSTFINNTAGNKGGGAIMAGNELNITNSTFINNKANIGGVLFGNDIGIINSNFTNNTATNIGGVVYCGNTLSIINSTLTQNKANSGGAVYIIGKLIINNSIVVNNNNNVTGSNDIFIDYNYLNNISLNNNWWGANNPNWGGILNNITYMPDNHIIMTFINITRSENNTVNLTVSLNTLNDTLTPINGLPERKIIFTSSDPNGKFTNNNTYFTKTINSTFTGDYTSTLKAFIDNEELKLNLKKNTNLTLDIQPLIISPTRLVKITPNLTPTNVTGMIIYYLDGKYYQTGTTKETITLTNISIGKHNITGTYTGNTEYLPSTNTIYFTVESDITFTIDVLTPLFYIGDNITIVPYLPDNATGTITYILDGKIITKTNKIHENQTIENILLGEHTLIASYSGDTQYVESIVTTNFTINKIPTTILIDPIVAQIGDNIQITANITNTRNKTIIGLVAFKLNGHTIGKQNITNGQAILNYTIPDNYSSKNYTITVVYGENNIFTKATTNTTLTLTKKQAKIQITPLNTYAGTKINLTTNTTECTKETPINTGTIVYKINGKTIGKTNITNGKATLTYKIPDNYTSKNYTITAVLSDKNYQRTETNTTLTIQKAPTNIETSPLIIPEKTPFTITAKITNNQTQKPITTGKTGIKINQKTLTNNLTPDTNGIITYTINNNTYKKGTHNITIMYGETKNNQETRTQTTLTIT